MGLGLGLRVRVRPYQSVRLAACQKANAHGPRNVPRTCGTVVARRGITQKYHAVYCSGITDYPARCTMVLRSGITQYAAVVSRITQHPARCYALRAAPCCTQYTAVVSRDILHAAMHHAATAACRGPAAPRRRRRRQRPAAAQTADARCRSHPRLDGQRR